MRSCGVVGMGGGEKLGRRASCGYFFAAAAVCRGDVAVGPAPSGAAGAPVLFRPHRSSRPPPGSSSPGARRAAPSHLSKGACPGRRCP